MKTKILFTNLIERDGLLYRYTVSRQMVKKHIAIGVTTAYFEPLTVRGTASLRLSKNY